MEFTELDDLSLLLVKRGANIGSFLSSPTFSINGSLLVPMKIGMCLGMEHFLGLEHFLFLKVTMNKKKLKNTHPRRIEMEDTTFEVT